MKPYFITGTDTNCGKTYVTGSLLHWYKKLNRKAHAVKLLASGEIAGVNEDVSYLQASTAYPLLPVNAFSFKEPLSPHIASKRAGVALSIQTLVDFCKQPSFYPLDNLLIEGAGGLMVPLNKKETWLHFLKLSEFPVILVVGLRLGCLNHALLSAAVLKASGIFCAGWIANYIDKDMLALEENRETLISWLDFPLLGEVSHQGSFCPSHNACILTW
jgi:dethiobiotin synthetase